MAAYTKKGSQPYVCTSPAYYRISGICGGSYEESTKEEYELQCFEFEVEKLIKKYG